VLASIGSSSRTDPSAAEPSSDSKRYPCTYTCIQTTSRSTQPLQSCHHRHSKHDTCGRASSNRIVLTDRSISCRAIIRLQAMPMHSPCSHASTGTASTTHVVVLAAIGSSSRTDPSAAEPSSDSKRYPCTYTCIQTTSRSTQPLQSCHHRHSKHDTCGCASSNRIVLTDRSISCRAIIGLQTIPMHLHVHTDNKQEHTAPAVMPAQAQQARHMWSC